MLKVEYKSPGVDEWQVLELVIDRVHHQVWALEGPSESKRREREHREAVWRAGQPQNLSELVSALFGDRVPREDPSRGR